MACRQHWEQRRAGCTDFPLDPRASARPQRNVMSTSNRLDDAQLPEAPPGAVELVTCSECGANLSPYVSRCPKCGHHAHHVHAGSWGWREKLIMFVVALAAGAVV